MTGGAVPHGGKPLEAPVVIIAVTDGAVVLAKSVGGKILFKVRLVVEGHLLLRVIRHDVVTGVLRNDESKIESYYEGNSDKQRCPFHQASPFS